MEKLEALKELKNLIEKYNNTIRYKDKKSISEETIRTWINDFLYIFGWDVQDTTHVLQERVLKDQKIKNNLKSINSTHSKPDYTFIYGNNIKTFLDAKSLDVNIFTDKDAAFQIRSYGWSAGIPCSFITNFEQFCIFDTRLRPTINASAKTGVIQLTVDQYIEWFDCLYEHLSYAEIINGNLNLLYDNKKIEGIQSIDKSFLEDLSKYRTIIAEDLFAQNREIIKNDEILNYYTQIILDRVIFIRVCESKGIEKIELLKNLRYEPIGAWESFKNACKGEFYKHYDGAMFEIDSLFQSLKLDNTLFNDFIDSLYYPNPYKFDIIPISIIANIYEQFLGKQLSTENGHIQEVIKEDYIKTNGAIPTPKHIVSKVCKETLELEKIQTITDLLSLKILDPCCGSGIFLITAYEILEKKIIELVKKNCKDFNMYKDLFYVKDDAVILTVKGRRALITNCIHGIDYDYSAVEVIKMSLALKIVEGTNQLNLESIGFFGEKILREISTNIKAGNTLVDTDSNFDPNTALKLKPLDLKNSFYNIFSSKSGFDFIIGNPPYVETKYYKEFLPSMHAYLSNKYDCFHKKADLAVLFIERCMNILNKDGVLGFIIQRRWFRTQYGEKIRNLISSKKQLSKLIDYKATDIFPGRITYVSILVLSKREKTEFLYQFNTKDSQEIKRLYNINNTSKLMVEEDNIKLQIPDTGKLWGFEYHEIYSLNNTLTHSIGVLGDVKGLKIRDGIQALWKKYYHFKPISIDEKYITGKNGAGEKETLERAAMKAVLYNRDFYPFMDVYPDAYSIFPYDGESTNVLSLSFIKTNYPKLYDYLIRHEELIKNNVETRKDGLWYAFTREHNHTLYNSLKIIVPMTSVDTIATAIPDKGIYMDNANVWFITIEKTDKNTMKALSCLINSTVFSVLAKSGANPQSGGYFKFNKQFLIPVAFPCEKFNDDKVIYKLSQYYDDIKQFQDKYLSCSVNEKDILSASLNTKWNELDNYCYELYGLKDEEVDKLKSVGRTDRLPLIK